MSGQLKRDDFLASVVTARSAVNTQRECQGYFYAGAQALINHDIHGVLSDFERVVGTRQITLPEYLSARAELRGLQGRR